MWRVVYRPHNELMCNTRYIGPFETFAEAEEGLCGLPALGPHDPRDGDGVCIEPGVKFIEALEVPARLAPEAPAASHHPDWLWFTRAGY